MYGALTSTASISASSIARDGAQNRAGASQNSLNEVEADDVWPVDFKLE